MSTTLWKPLHKFLHTYIHNNDIRSDLLDIFITDHIVRVAPKQSTPFILSRNDQLKDLSGTLIKLKITGPLTLPSF